MASAVAANIVALPRNIAPFTVMFLWRQWGWIDAERAIAIVPARSLAFRRKSVEPPRRTLTDSKQAFFYLTTLQRAEGKKNAWTEKFQSGDTFVINKYLC